MRTYIHVLVLTHTCYVHIVFAQYGWSYDLNSDLVRPTPMHVPQTDVTATQELPLSGIQHSALCSYILIYIAF